MKKHGQGTHSTKMGADILAKKTQMPQNLSVQFVCPRSKVLDFNKKMLHWAFVVRGWNEDTPNGYRFSCGMRKFSQDFH